MSRRAQLSLQTSVAPSKGGVCSTCGEKRLNALRVTVQEHGYVGEEPPFFFRVCRGCLLKFVGALPAPRKRK